MKIAVVSPHRDDVAFSLDLTVAALLAAGHSIDVVNCFTRTEYAPYASVESIDVGSQIRSISELRASEDKAWMASHGARLKIIDLDLEDAPKRLAVAIDQVCSTPAAQGDGAGVQIQRGLESISPDAIILPLGIGKHVDHLTARNGGIAFLQSSMPCAFYEDLPYAARTGEAQNLEASAINLKRGLIPVFATSVTNAIDAEARKYRATRFYASQINEGVMQDIANFCQRYGGRERLWANAAWCEAPLGVTEHHSEAVPL